jgi:ABC-type multidrug transport system fused ATPase/permease subunit
LLQTEQVGVSLVEARLSLARMQLFCEAPEVARFPAPEAPVLLRFDRASFAWSEKKAKEDQRQEQEHDILLRDASGDEEDGDDDEDCCLRDISLEVRSGEFVWVVGRVGCGKSSLLAAALGEMCMRTGTAQVVRLNTLYNEIVVVCF